MPYKREKAYAYAKQWAFKRNPKYYNFDSVGGDCTSFVSQCLFAATDMMNYTKDTGWYYVNGNRKSPSWSGVEFLYHFLTQNKGVGPFAQEVSIDKVEVGDIAQFSFNGDTFEHSVIIVKIDKPASLHTLYSASHTDDSFERPLISYPIAKIRFLHIEGYRTW